MGHLNLKYIKIEIKIHFVVPTVVFCVRLFGLIASALAPCLFLSKREDKITEPKHTTNIMLSLSMVFMENIDHYWGNKIQYTWQCFYSSEHLKLFEVDHAIAFTPVELWLMKFFTCNVQSVLLAAQELLSNLIAAEFKKNHLNPPPPPPAIHF